MTAANDSSGHANIDACVPAEYGVFLRAGIAALLRARVCRRDPRTLGQQRVDALAELIGTPGVRLTCRCGDDDCPAGRAPTDPTSGPTDPTQPPAPDGGRDGDHDGGDATDIDGSNDDGALPERSNRCDDAARDETRADGTDSARADNTVADAEPDPASEPDGASGSALTPAAPPWTLELGPDGIEVPRLRGYGAIDPALADRLSDRATLITLPNHQNRRPSGLIVLGERGPGPPVDPSGHGGHDLPPPGALTYAPSTRVREQVLLSDRYCRYPFCGRPAHECELDHLVKFRRGDPQTGGWTLPANLAPLCRPDHQRKHLGMWIPTMNIDRTITWRNPVTGKVIVTYPR